MIDNNTIADDSTEVALAAEDETPLHRLTELQEQLVLMLEAGADGFDPVRFQFMRSMLQRAKDKHPQQAGVSAALAEKVSDALALYQADLEQAKAAALLAIQQYAQNNTEQSAELLALLARYDFSAIKQRIQPPYVSEARQSLRQLSQQLVQAKPVTDQSSKGLAFDEFLREQEQQLVNSLTEIQPSSTPDSLTEQPSLFAPAALDDDHLELKSNRRFRQAKLKAYADQLVSLAIAEGPENPGPLNPHMLAIRSMSNMRDLSPHYLNRFVAYVDGLLWLEASAEKLDADADKAQNKDKKKHSAKKKA